MVKTRSQTKKEQEQEQEIKETLITQSEPKQLYEVNIDFDEASQAWHANKKSIGNGHYKYICTFKKNDIKCGKNCYKDLSYCWIHRSARN
jgi:hypothetical protein